MTHYPLFDHETRELLAKSTVQARAVTPLYDKAAPPHRIVEDSLREQVAAFLVRERVERTADRDAGLETHELRLLCLSEEALFRLIQKEAMRLDSQRRMFEPPTYMAPMEHAP